jgi:hypothetical protein
LVLESFRLKLALCSTKEEPMGLASARSRRNPPNFQLAWAAYPSQQAPCDQKRPDGSLAWENQCAIRLSIALQGAGFALSGYTEPTCKHGHARGAESLANYLWRQLGPPGHTSAKQVDLSGQRGIVFFKDIQGFRGGIGDHIDLWNLHTTRTGAYFAVSRAVWFWNLS